MTGGVNPFDGSPVESSRKGWGATNTGLPEVPAGYYWQVWGTDSESFTEHLTVQLRQKTPVWAWLGLVFSVPVLSGTALPPYTDQRIRETAQTVLDAWKLAEQADKDAKRFIGKYPPKKLGA